MSPHQYVGLAVRLYAVWLALSALRTLVYLSGEQEIPKALVIGTELGCFAAAVGL